MCFSGVFLGFGVDIFSYLMEDNFFYTFICFFFILLLGYFNIVNIVLYCVKTVDFVY